MADLLFWALLLRISLPSSTFQSGMEIPGNLDTAWKLNSILFLKLQFLIETTTECKLLFSLIELLLTF